MSLNSNIKEKKYLELDLVQIIDQDTIEGKLAWEDLTDHHLFRGNDTMMQLYRFYAEKGVTIKEYEDEREENLKAEFKKLGITYNKTIFEGFRDVYEMDQKLGIPKFDIRYRCLAIFVLRYLRDNGYTQKDLEQYDDILLNITW